MPKSVWPPALKPHSSGHSRFRYKGEEYWCGRTGTAESLIRYGEHLARIQEEAGQGAAPAGGAVTWPCVAEVVARWRREVMCDYDPAGKEPENFDLMFRRLLPACGTLPTNRFDLARLKALREGWASAWCAATVNRQVNRVRLVMRWAEQAGMAPPGTWAALVALRSVRPNNASFTHRPRLRPLDQGQYELLLVCAHPCLQAMYEVQWWTGMRSGELRVMRPGDIDAEGDVWVYRPVRHKNLWRGHPREIPLGPRCQRVLAPWLAGKRPGEWVFPAINSARHTDRPRDAVRSGPRCYTCASYGKAFRYVAFRAALPEWTRPYCLRHSAKQRITRELGLDVARSVLGQKCLETADRYASGIDLGAAIDAAARLG